MKVVKVREQIESITCLHERISRVITLINDTAIVPTDVEIEGKASKARMLSNRKPFTLGCTFLALPHNR
jgi:hypothetical protein